MNTANEPFKPVWCTLHQAARELGFNPRKLLTLIERGDMPLRVERFGKSFFVSTASLEAYRAATNSPVLEPTA